MDKIEITDEMTGREIVEIGYGLLARGLFRIAEKEGLETSIDQAWFLVDQTKLLAFDIERKRCL